MEIETPYRKWQVSNTGILLLRNKNIVILSSWQPERFFLPSAHRKSQTIGIMGDQSGALFEPFGIIDTGSLRGPIVGSFWCRKAILTRLLEKSQQWQIKFQHGNQSKKKTRVFFRQTRVSWHHVECRSNWGTPWTPSDHHSTIMQEIRWAFIVPHYAERQ